MRYRLIWEILRNWTLFTGTQLTGIGYTNCGVDKGDGKGEVAVVSR